MFVISYDDNADNVDEQLLQVLVDSATLLIASKAREVVLSALGFIKTLLLSFSANFGPFLNQVVSIPSVILSHCYIYCSSYHAREMCQYEFCFVSYKFTKETYCEADSFHSWFFNCVIIFGASVFTAICLFWQR